MSGFLLFACAVKIQFSYSGMQVLNHSKAELMVNISKIYKVYSDKGVSSGHEKNIDLRSYRAPEASLASRQQKSYSTSKGHRRRIPC